MDLLAYKEPWLAWCDAQGTRPSKAFRQIVAKLTAPKEGVAPIPAAASRAKAPTARAQIEPQRAKHRREIALTDAELLRVEEIAYKEGYSVSQWLVALVRSRLTSRPEFGQHELATLGRSNLELLAIGRNLNQVAKALNTNPHDRGVYQVEQIERLEATVRRHVREVAGVMASNQRRWGVA